MRWDQVLEVAGLDVGRYSLFRESIEVVYD